MKKIAKHTLMFCITGTLSLTFVSISQDNLTKAETITQQMKQMKKDKTLIISGKEQNVAESFGSAMPLANLRLNYYQRPDGTGFFFKKAQNGQ